jgi:hypothetical protein
MGGGKQRDGELHDGLDQQNCGHDKALRTAPAPAFHVGAAARCDLLMLILRGRIKKSQPRFTRQLLQGNTICGTLRSFDVDFAKQNQKIAASFHSSAPTGQHELRHAAIF